MSNKRTCVIRLLNMPFAAPDVPSLALTQLKTVLRDVHGTQVQVEIVYLNYDFIHFLGGHEAYQFILGMEGLVSGLGDWFFRQAAFPWLEDNSDDYFRRYHNGGDAQSAQIRRTIREKRLQLSSFLDELIDRYHLAEADLVGFTSLFSQNVSSFAMARMLKERKANIITVMGGPNCEYPMGDAIARNVEAIDFVFGGPALENFPRLVGHLIEGQPESCQQLEGVFSSVNPRSAQNKTGEPVERGPERDFEHLVDLDYDDFLEAFDRHYGTTTLEPTLLFQTSTGCSWGERCQCSFCGVNGASLRYRHMSPERAREQFAVLFDRYGDRCRRFDGVDNIVPRVYLKELFPHLEAPGGALLFYETKSDLSLEELRVLSRAGTKFVQPGIEALSTPLLKLMRKGTSAFGNLRFLKNCLLSDVYPFWNLLVGLPDTDEEVYLKYLEDIPTLHHLPPPTGAYPIRFDRFSLYFKQAVEYQLDLHPYDFYGLTYPFDEESLSQLAYFFADHNSRAEYALQLSRWLQQLREKVTAWLNSWYAPENKERPKLHFLDEQQVFDSRFDAGRTIVLRAEEAVLLRRLEQQAGCEKLIVEFGSGITAALEALQKHRLLFKEGELFMSLVAASNPPTMTCDLTLALKQVEKKAAVSSAVTPGTPDVIKRLPRRGRKVERPN
ncbi:RiPP maturation radical SAM C-methyltransferase [Desulfopila sp. IMCC35008]|uniref:RiPP maturation radical SAM C-methyltransferase n=1 Tax=Desulfopila sp. IMCC35008 TaxID=2653858 RepID=UPI0013D6D1D9|nr:RiPP maturation radical SAM C-methyltransferase [Desulfopila sp. IMCC35008]